MTWSRALFAIALWSATALAGEPPWWDDDWELRHRLLIPEQLPPRVDAISVEMTTFGRVRADARDLRVVSRTGVVCEHRLLMKEAGDRLRFLFRPIEGERVYHAYFGNPRAQPPGMTLHHRAGMVVEVRALPVGGYRSAQQVIALWDRADEVYGRALRQRIFDGTNPVGPVGAGTFIARYRGYFAVDEEGGYRFCTASGDASVVRIDGKVVAEWGGAHDARAGRRGRYGGAIRLSAGVHLLEYFWVNASPLPATAVLGWQRPRDLFPRLMPAYTILQARRAVVGAAEQRGGKPLADFSWQTLHHLDRDGLHAVTLLFRETTRLGGSGLQYEWDFGDGTRAPGRAVRKVFFGRGLRRVTLKVHRDGLALAGTLLVDVQPLPTQVRPPKGNSLAGYRKALQALDPMKSTLGELAAMVALADDLKVTGRLREFWDALSNVPAAESDARFGKVAAYLGRRFQRPPFCNARSAEAALRTGLEASVSERTRTRMVLGLADLLVNARGNPDAAEATLKLLASRKLDRLDLRAVSILRGDIAAERAQVEEAAKRYAQAGATVRAWDRRTQLRRSAALFSAEDFVRRGEYEGAADLLAHWMLAQPDERLSTRCLRMLGQAHEGSGYGDKAAVLYERALRLEPWGPEAPRLLLALADLRRAQKNEKAAAAHDALLLERFPYSDEAVRLKARTKGIKSE